MPLRARRPVRWCVRAQARLPLTPLPLNADRSAKKNGNRDVNRKTE
jgi:hypothetical protein